MKSFFRAVTMAAVAAFVGSAICLAEEAVPAAATPSAEQQAQMEQIKQRTTPGQQHKILEAMAGNWTYTSKFWMSAEGKPEESSGTSASAMIYGGRFLKQEIKGTWMGQPFEGVGFTGYDNIKGEYVMTWIDGMATGIMNQTGTYNTETKSIQFTGANSCPLTGEKARAGRSECKTVDADHHTYTAFAAGADGKEFKIMEISYTRSV